MELRFPCFGKLMAAVLAVLIGSTAQAGLRWIYSDDEVIQKSNLIVVGHLDGTSIKSLSCDRGYQEYEAILVIGKVLKGNSSVASLNIVIHHGLEIVRSEEESPMHAIANSAWKGGIEIWDTGNSLLQGSPVIANAEKDAIWFLANHDKHCVKEASLLGVEGPEDIQPVKYMEYFLALMVADPEHAVKELVAQKPEMKERAGWLLEKWAISELIPLNNCKEKITKLVPYLNWATCESVPLADRVVDPLVVGCGTHQRLIAEVLDPCSGEVGPVLAEAWKSKKLSFYRRYMAGFFAKSKYLPAIPLLEDLINEENQYFSTHPLPVRWLWLQGTTEGERIYHNYAALRAAMWAMKEMGANSKSNASILACSWWIGLKEKPSPPDMPCQTN